MTRVNHESHFSWQAQYLVILQCHFSWQVQYLVKSSWVDSRSAKCCNFQHKMRCRGWKSKLCERTGSVLQFHGRIMFGSCSNRPRIGNGASTVFGKFFLDFGVRFCVAGAVFGEVGG